MKWKRHIVPSVWPSEILSQVLLLQTRPRKPKKQSRYFRDVYSPETCKALLALKKDEMLMVTANSPYRDDRTFRDAIYRMREYFCTKLNRRDVRVLFDGRTRFFVFLERI